MDRTGSHDVIIAGGGLVGLTLAVALAKLASPGFRVAIVEGRPLHPEPGKDDMRASALSAGSQHLLSVLGIWPDLERHAQAVEKIEITDSPLEASLRPLFLSFSEQLADREAGIWIVENARLRQALLDALSRVPVELIAPDRIVDYAADAFGVTVELGSGSVARARLVVAADGKHSRLRDQAGIKCVGWSYPQIGIVATVGHAEPHRGRAVQHFLPAGPFAMLPLTGNRCSIVWSETKLQGEAIMQADAPEFLAELRRRFGYRLGEIELAGLPACFPLDVQIARSFIADRLALLGDAAHVVHPLAGQGLNIGLRDVAALAETIIEATRLGLDIGSRAVLERYERWRRFDSALSASVMDGLNRLFSNDNVPLRGIRDVGLGLVDRAPALKRFFVREAAGLTGAVPRLLKGETI